MRKVCLIDVSGFVYRAFYGFQDMTQRLNDGSIIEIGAVYGFCSAMLKLMSTFKNSMFVAALDSSRHTFRSEIYSQYKANRKSTPPELSAQFPIIHEACGCFGFCPLTIPGFEADDIIASYVKTISERQGYEIVVISSDKDLMQLLNYDQTYSKIRLYDPMKQKFITGEDVMEKFGVPPNMILDVMALMGDNADNIPGVPGIGIKTAAALIREFGSLENLILNLDNLPRNKKNETLKKEIDKAILSKRLATLKSDIEIDFQYSEVVSNEIEAFLSKFNLISLIQKHPTRQKLNLLRKIEPILH
jgi:DNA polymerase-1